jgi:hypothetical protein
VSFADVPSNVGIKHPFRLDVLLLAIPGYDLKTDFVAEMKFNNNNTRICGGDIRASFSGPAIE